MHDNADREHERLWSIAEEWASDGHVVGDPPAPVKGTDTYEVLAGGYFLVHHVDVFVGDQEVRAIEVIGEPASAGGGFLAARVRSTLTVASDRRSMPGVVGTVRRRPQLGAMDEHHVHPQAVSVDVIVR